jgi:hypothetical protein
VSRGQRVGLLAAAAAVAVAAFVIAKPGSDDNQTEKVTRIELKQHQPVSGPRRIKVAKGDRVRIVVTSNAPDELHLHGYDIEREVAPGNPARFGFEARLEGVFQLESHKTENEVAKLQVEPR